MKPHFQCVEQVKSPSNLTKYCACHEILKLKISADTPWMLPPIERRFEDNPTIKSSSRTRRFGDLTRPILDTILYCKIQHFALRLAPKMSRSAAPVTKSHPPTSPNTAPATQNRACHTKWTMNCDFTELWLYWTVTFTELLLYWTVTVTELWLYWNCDFTELLLYWIVTVLNCDCTELLPLTEAVTLLNCDCTELWLYWTVTLLNCDCTELWLYWTVYFTELLLDWSVTLLNCYFTELLHY